MGNLIRKLKPYLGWIATIFMVLFALVYMVSFASLAFILAAVAVCPLTSKVLEKSGKKPMKVVRIGLCIVLFFVGCMVAPTSEAGSEGSKAAVETAQDIDSNAAEDSVAKEETTEEVAEEAQTAEEKEETVPETPAVIPTTSEMKVHFIDVGQGDAILISSSGQYMLIDAGNNNKADVVISYLKSQGVTDLAYVIGTHPHADHIGGLDQVISTFNVGQIIMPNMISTTQTFEDVLTAISNKGMKITAPVVGTEYVLGNAKFMIIAPNGTYSNENNASVGIKLVNGSNSFVMCGDAEMEAEYDITSNGINLDADVLKLGHHGSDTATTEAMLKAATPTYAVISVGAGNQYGHPCNETIQKLINGGIQTFRTDEQGTIVASSDGTSITFSCVPTELKLAEVTPAATPEVTPAATPEVTPEVTPTPTPAPQDTQSTEVYMTKTGECYHRDGCSSLRRSKIAVSLNDAKARGLRPCENCDPPQ